MFGKEGQHVALSIGETTKSGPLVLELDAATKGVTVSSILDILIRNNAYGRYIAWGPLP